MAGHRENADFAKDILPQYLLDDATEWIQKNMEPEDVFTDEQLKEWADSWCSNNGMVIVEAP